jgi:hypothetical protein
MYVVEMVKGFEKMAALKAARVGSNREERFARIFPGRKYVSATYDLQVSHLKAATPSEIRRGVDAGRTRDGLWTIWRRTLGSATELGTNEHNLGWMF